MIQLASGILGAVAATLTLGAVHLEVATGNDLFGPRHLVSSQSEDAIAGSVDRTNKGDRLEIPVAGEPAQNLTLSFKLPGAADSSVMMRVPVRAVVRNLPATPKTSASNGKRMIACETSVSVLTPAAKQLEPARCVT
jgi:hypothetical protein